MSSFHQFFSVNHEQLIGLIESGNAEHLARRMTEAIANEFGWGENEDEAGKFVREVCERVMARGEHATEECGVVYFGLMMLCEHKSLPADGWKAHYTEDVASFVKGTSVPDYVKEIFSGLHNGRNPWFDLMDRDGDDVVACFIRAEEAERLFDDIDACPDFADGKIPDPDVAEIIFNDLLPALDRELPEGHCVVVLTL
ncbi:hypothetical protein ACFL34_01695 [Candidatus Sumerlaeota bacterium]